MLRDFQNDRSIINIGVRFVIGVAVVLTLAITGPNSSQASNAVQRPISDFLTKQGTTMIFNAPVPDQIGWTNNPTTLFALFDFTGLTAEYLEDNYGISLGTTITGSVNERPLRDGRAEVTVILHTQRALAWAAGVNPDPNLAPPSFGYRPAEIANDPSKMPALGECQLHVVFTNTAPGADLPDLVNAFILGNATPEQELIFISFHGNASGSLRAAAGLGPEGTPGRLMVAETGTLARGNVGDGFPAENIELRPLRR